MRLFKPKHQCLLDKAVSDMKKARTENKQAFNRNLLSQKDMQISLAVAGATGIEDILKGWRK